MIRMVKRKASVQFVNGPIQTGARSSDKCEVYWRLGNLARLLITDGLYCFIPTAHICQNFLSSLSRFGRVTPITSIFLDGI